MAKNQNTFAKRQREMEKKRKAEEKRARRKSKKDEPSEPANDSYADTGDEVAAESETGDAGDNGTTEA